MKKVLITIVCVFLVLGVCAAGEKPELSSQKDKESYSIGFQVGASIKTDGVEVSFERLVEGLKDGIEHLGKSRNDNI